MDSQTSDSMQSILSRNGTANSSSKNSYFGEDNDEIKFKFSYFLF